jgi:transcriptional adapter 2-alpha
MLRKYHCDNCSVDITSTTRIRCAAPQCQEYDLCVQCTNPSQGRLLTAGFAQNTTEHTRHPYSVIEQCALPIIHPDWSADEELLLIEASESAGLGNWADVAEQVTSRSKEELEKHYLDCYLNSPGYPLPVTSHPRGDHS